MLLPGHLRRYGRSGNRLDRRGRHRPNRGHRGRNGHGRGSRPLGRHRDAPGDGRDLARVHRIRSPDGREDHRGVDGDTRKGDGHDRLAGERNPPVRQDRAACVGHFPVGDVSAVEVRESADDSCLRARPADIGRDKRSDRHRKCDGEKYSRTDSSRRELQGAAHLSEEDREKWGHLRSSSLSPALDSSPYTFV